MPHPESQLLLKASFEELSQEIVLIQAQLNKSYEHARSLLTKGDYEFNSSLMRELSLYLKQMQTVLQYQEMVCESDSAWKQQQAHEECVNIPCNFEEWMEAYRDKAELILNKQLFEENNIMKIHQRCLSAHSLVLHSTSLSVIDDHSLLQLKSFSNLSKLTIKNSQATDQALISLLASLNSLKEIDISSCFLLTNEVLGHLSGYQFVSIKMNSMTMISEEACLQLVESSYNLNYLEVSGTNLNGNELLVRIGDIYLQNPSNFKWLQVQAHPWLVLFINKLSYLTHLTIADNINDQEFKILIGEEPTLNALHFNCCEQLHKETIAVLVNKCKRMKHLRLHRYLSLSDSLVGELVSELVHLEVLDLSECYLVTNKSLLHIANQLSHLQWINLSRCSALTNDGLIYLFQKMPTLTHVDISHCKNISNEVVLVMADCLPSLNFVNLQKCERLTDQAISYLANKCPLLETLILNYCEGVTDASVNLIADRLTKLKRLEIEWCAVTQKCLIALSSALTQLETVNFSYCPTVGDQPITRLARNNLKSIKMQSCDKISSHAFLELFKNCKEVQYMDVSIQQCLGVNDQVLSRVSEVSACALKYVDVGWCKEITDDGLFSLSQYQHQIKHFNLSGCNLVTDTGIEWVCSTIKGIQYLNLSFCQRLTDQAILNLALHLSQLRVLYLCDLKLITDSSISNLCEVTGLEELYVSGCPQITSTSLIALLHNLQKLQCLSISQCCKIYPNSLMLLVQRMRNLRKFELASLEIQDEFLQAVANHMHKLKFINLEYCRRITGQALIKMIEKLPLLTRVDIQNSSVSEREKQLIFKLLTSRRSYNEDLQ